jgi:hypothetical protein
MKRGATDVLEQLRAAFPAEPISAEGAFADCVERRRTGDAAGERGGMECFPRLGAQRYRVPGECPLVDGP